MGTVNCMGSRRPPVPCRQCAKNERRFEKVVEDILADITRANDELEEARRIQYAESDSDEDEFVTRFGRNLGP